MYEGIRDHGSFRVSHRRLTRFISRSVADVLSTVSRVLPFRNATIRAMRSSLNDASRVVPWACSALARTSSFFATMVRASSGTFHYLLADRFSQSLGCM